MSEKREWPFEVNDAPNAFSIEPHGSGYAIYLGRGPYHHGLNLAYVTEVDPNFKDQLFAHINRAAPAAEDVAGLIEYWSRAAHPEDDRMHPIRLTLSALRSLSAVRADRDAKTARMWELGHECDKLAAELAAARKQVEALADCDVETLRAAAAALRYTAGFLAADGAESLKADTQAAAIARLAAALTPPTTHNQP